MIKTQILSVRTYFISVNLFWLASKSIKWIPIVFDNYIIQFIPLFNTHWYYMLVFENYILWVIFFLLRLRLFISNVQITFSLFYSMSVETRQFFPTLYLVHSSIRFEIYSCICWSWTICIFSYNLLSFLQLICFLDRPASNWLELNLNQNDLKIRTKRYVYINEQSCPFIW